MIFYILIHIVIILFIQYIARRYSIHDKDIPIGRIPSTACGVHVLPDEPQDGEHRNVRLARTYVRGSLPYPNNILKISKKPKQRQP